MRRPAFIRGPRSPRSGSLTRRMIGVSALWILVLLGGGAVALDRVLTSAITSNFDAQLEYVMTALIASAEVGPDAEVRLNRPPADQRFLEPYSGLYFQIAAARPSTPSEGPDLDLPSRSLWDRRLLVAGAHADSESHTYDSSQFPTETLRVV